METYLTIEEKVFEIHDFDVNQKYGDKLSLPYSFHIKMVLTQCKKFKKLLTSEEFTEAYLGCLLHDIQEDARMTYNDIKELILSYNGHNTVLATKVADIVYCVTDFKGKNRAERKPPQYYIDLNNNKTALYVKLCDMIANKYFSCMTDSTMKDAYNKEFPSFKEKCYYEPYKEMFDFLEKIE